MEAFFTDPGVAFFCGALSMWIAFRTRQME